LRAAIVFQDSVSGLMIGAPVTFRGVRVGAVESIAVAYDARSQAAYIPVTIQLEPRRVVVTDETGGAALDFPKLIARGLRAELYTQSFVTGQSEISLDFDAASAAVLHADITSLPEIPTRPSAIQRVKAQLTELPLRELAESANATLHSLRELSDKLNQTLPPLVDSLKVTSDRSAEALGAAGRAMTGLQGRLDHTLGDISHLATAGNQWLTLRGAELHAVLVASDQTALLARDVLANLKTMTSERGADRVNIDATLRDLATASAALRGLANDVEHNPQLLLTGRRP
jgi:paraquat-inducible protein B